ncbi:MAG: Wzz/FepE/Etk N-terminal domain-containing protein [Firmicutes bacterium]|nr:Wzz/FepE/Etk N-terminal domain-containing protein [Bacillota bacterium]
MEIKEYLQVIRKRLWIVVAAMLILMIIAAAFSYFALEPVYESNTLLYVGKNVNVPEGIEYYDLLISDRLVKDYRELVNSRLVANTVIEELGLTDMNISQLVGKLSVNLKDDTRLIQIKAEHTHPEMAKNIAAKVTEVFKEKAIELMDVENVHVIDEAEVPEAPIRSRKVINVVVAAIVGVMIGLGIILLIEYFDDTIKTPEDVQKHLGLPVIGTIPAFSE